MYFDEPVDRIPINAAHRHEVGLSLNGIAMLALGILPGGLMALCENAIAASLQ
jgi:NADH-quinone oxidoreductase subunit N